MQDLALVKHDYRRLAPVIETALAHFLTSDAEPALLRYVLVLPLAHHSRVVEP